LKNANTKIPAPLPATNRKQKVSKEQRLTPQKNIYTKSFAMLASNDIWQTLLEGKATTRNITHANAYDIKNTWTWHHTGSLYKVWRSDYL